MASYDYERLSAQDSSFLFFERSTVHMHVAATQIFEAGPLQTEGGGIDIDAFRKAIDSILYRIPRYRQKLRWIPFENHPVWVDDRDFHLDYHIRHTALPQPGSEEQLKRLAARVMAQQLDRARPLWELWVIEGLEGNRFAVISKIHHCMVDGSSGVDLAYILMSTESDYRLEPAPPFMPRPVPSMGVLMRDSMLRWVGLPFQVLRGLRRFRREVNNLGEDVALRARALKELAGWAVRQPSHTPLNGKLGPHRRFDWLTMPLEDVKVTRRAYGCSLNDVVLATVAGAVRRFLLRRQVRPEGLDFRIAAPVSVRREDERGKPGNRVSSWIIRLPIGEADPRKRLEELHATTRKLKESRQALGVEMLMQVAEWTPNMLLSLGARAASGPINAIVTNVPGPQMPLYMIGAKLLAMYPQVPLLPGTGLGIALLSYDGKLCWGFNADYALMPDLRDFVFAIDASFQELAEAADPDAARPSGADSR